MPHHTRHKKKKKKPNREQPLQITDPDALLLHRELAMLRIAGGARPGRKKKKLLNERYSKLEQARRKVDDNNQQSER